MLSRLIAVVYPADHVHRALTIATLSAALSTGLFYSVSALYFTRVIGLDVTTVGAGLTIAGAVGVAASFIGGHAADRVGADRLQLWANAAQGLALLAYVFAGDAVSFTLIACVAVGARSLQGTAKATVLARWFTGPERVGIRAQLRVVTNVSIGMGTVLASIALLIGTDLAYRVTMVAVGLLTAAATIPLSGLRRRVDGFAAAMDTHLAPDRTPGPSPLRDRTYLSVVGMNAVIAMQFGLTSVGVPLWIATRTQAPEVMISVLLVVNTAFVALFQVRAAHGTHDVRVAGRVVRRGSLLLAVACLLFGAAGSVDFLWAIVILVVAELFASWAEVWCEAGSWGLAFELADPRSAGRYQGLSQTGYAVSGMLSPAVVTATAVNQGMPGWILLGAVFAVAGTAVSFVAGRAKAPVEAAVAGG